MTRSPDNPSATTLSPSLALLSILLVSLAFPFTATADESPDSDDEGPQDVRFETTFQPADDRPSLDLRVYGAVDETRRIWHVTVTSEASADDFICLTTLPLEAGDDFYEYDLHEAALADGDGTRAILLEAAPTGDGAPLDPPAYQLAFALRPDDGSPRWRCELVARGEYTELDGGPRLSIEDVDDHAQLIQSDVTQRLEFCGASDEETDDFEKFDPGIGRFVRGTPLEITDDDATSLTAELPDTAIAPPLTTGFYAWLIASSDVRGAPAGAAAPRPTRLGELDVTRAWIEGTDGLGVGEFVTAAIEDTASLRGLRIFPGHGSSPEAFRAYARPTGLLIGLSEGRRYTIDLPDYDYDDVEASGGFYVEFPEPVTSHCLSVMILDAHAGEPPDPTDPEHRQFASAVAISEITPFSQFDAATESETARRIIAEIADEPDREQRDRIAEFGALIPGAMVDATREALAEEDERARARVIPILRYADSDLALPLLRTHFLDASVDDEAYRRTKRAIAAHGSRGAPVLLDVLRELDMDEKKYVDAVRIVGRIGSDVHLQRLIAELGEGGEFLRRERVRAIANGGVSVVPGLVSRAKAQPNTDAGLDALSAIVFIGQRHFSQQQADIDRTDELRDVYLASEQRSHRIRALEALGYFAHPDGVELIGEQVLSDDPDPVVRAFAARALQLYPDESARLSLETALEDDSPDVRIAAIRTLNRRDDAAEATDSVIDYVERETWPTGLHHGFQVLANSPEPAARRAVADIIARDITSRSAATAMRAMRRADRPLPRSHIENHLADEATPHPILEQLVHMVGLADFDGADDILIDIAHRRYPPLEDRPADELDALAHRAFPALGVSRTDEARDFLFDAAFDDDRSETDRYHALHGLGFFPDPDLLYRLDEKSSDVPPQLRRRFRQTITMIENRLGIEDAEQELEELIESLEE